MLGELETEDELTSAGDLKLFPELENELELEEEEAELELHVGSPSHASTAPERAPLPSDVYGWILDTNRSAINLIANPTLRNRFLREIHWSREYFPPDPPDKDATGRGRLAEHLFNAMARVIPERRVPYSLNRTSGLEYRPDIAHIVVPIPGEPKSHHCPRYKMLHPEASKLFVRMREAAAKDGIHIRLLDGCLTAWRTAKEQRDLSKAKRNRLAVAKGIGAHMYGLAVDLRLRVPGLRIHEAHTGEPEKMANVVRMYCSPIYKWLALNASRFGWYPYKREPWHWEYNPPGFKERYESKAGKKGRAGKSRELEFESELELEEELEEAAFEHRAWARPGPHRRRPLRAMPPMATGHWLKPFISRAIPNYPDYQPTACSVYVPNAAWGQSVIDLLVFFHGNPDGCMGNFVPDPKDTSKKFGLGMQIDSSGRKVALAVPVVHYSYLRGKWTDSNLQEKWTAKNLNKLVEEVRDQIGRQSGVKPTLSRLIIAGHSHAYAILTPLAREFHQGAAATKEGALSKLKEVWALDSTYGEGSVRALGSWARILPQSRFIAVLKKGSATIKSWNSYFSFGNGRVHYNKTKPPANLKMLPVSEEHCEIPARYIRTLLSTM